MRRKNGTALRWQATPVQTATLAFAGVLALGAGAYLLLPAVRAVVTLPDGVPLVASQAALILVFGITGTTRDQWPPRVTPLWLVAAMVVASDVVLVALVLQGSLPAIPGLAVDITWLVLIVTFIAQSLRRDTVDRPSSAS